MINEIEVITRTAGRPSGALLVAPLGIASGLGSTTGVTVEGGAIVETLCGIATGQPAALVEPDGTGRVRLRYRFAESPKAPRYPEAAFVHRPNRYTIAADDLAAASRGLSTGAGGGRNGIDTLVKEARQRFSYAHVEKRFNDDHDVVPYLGCGLAEGSCIDINTYLVASLRAAGFEAAYLYGYFFPEERGGVTYDMHCWVATRFEGEILEWDIAHHIKAGLGPVRPALNPRPGERVILGHSMGHRYISASCGEIAVKLLAEPQWVVPGGKCQEAGVEVIRVVG